MINIDRQPTFHGYVKLPEGRSRDIADMAVIDLDHDAMMCYAGVVQLLRLGFAPSPWTACRPGHGLGRHRHVNSETAKKGHERQLKCNWKTSKYVVPPEPAIVTKPALWFLAGSWNSEGRCHTNCQQKQHLPLKTYGWPLPTHFCWNA
jgi:hypothetical protein